MKSRFHPAQKEDLDGLKLVLDSSELFPSEYLEDMMSDYFNNPDSEEMWITQMLGEKIVGLSYCVPEKFTEGTYNLLAIAVSKDVQGKGLGSEMIDHVETELKSKSARLLIVDTSSDSQYELTRKFYLQLNYTQEAVIRDFWSEGDHKITFWKKLN